jgi:hypothetical protein
MKGDWSRYNCVKTGAERQGVYGRLRELREWSQRRFLRSKLASPL